MSPFLPLIVALKKGKSFFCIHLKKLFHVSNPIFPFRMKTEDDSGGQLNPK
jgi:hypothetical protein